MQAKLFEKSLVRGDVTLIGNDEIEIRAYSDVLELCEYFKASLGFSEGKTKTFTFQQYDSKHLLRLVKYLYGIHPACYNSEVIGVLEYFQAPMDGVVLADQEISDIRMEVIMQVYDRCEVTQNIFMDICIKILNEGLCTDKKVMDWLEGVKVLHNIRVNGYTKYRTLRIARHLIEGELNKVAEIYSGFNVVQTFTDLLECFGNTKFDLKYIIDYIAYATKKELNKKGLYTSNYDNWLNARALEILKYNNGILLDQGEKKMSMQSALNLADEKRSKEYEEEDDEEYSSEDE
nr:hypothetical protein K-LCC10_0472 [Kaumoebavirus]